GAIRQAVGAQQLPQLIGAVIGGVVVVPRAAVELGGGPYAIAPGGLRDVGHVGAGAGFELGVGLLVDGRPALAAFAGAAVDRVAGGGQRHRLGHLDRAVQRAAGIRRAETDLVV